MNFETTERIIAIEPNFVDSLFSDLLSRHGKTLPDGNRQVLTIGGHWDNSDKTRIRAASLKDGTIAPQPLKDGRVAFRCLWQNDLASSFDRGEIPQAQQITEDQLAQLTLQSEAL